MGWQQRPKLMSEIRISQGIASFLNTQYENLRGEEKAWVINEAAMTVYKFEDRESMLNDGFQPPFSKTSLRTKE